MADNILEIQVIDKPGVASDSSSAPPRPPAADMPPAPAYPRSAPPAATSTAGPLVQPAAKAQPQESLVDLIVDKLGFGREYRALRQVTDYLFGAKPQPPAPPVAPVAAPVLPTVQPVAQPTVVQQTAPPVEPVTSPAQSAAVQPAGQFPVDVLKGGLEQGFGKVAGTLRDGLQPIRDFFDAAEPAPAAAGQEKKASIEPPRPTTAHKPASADLRRNTDLDEVFGHACKPEPPRPPAPPRLQVMPGAAKSEPPKPPLTAPTSTAAAGEGAAVEGAAAGAGEVAAGAGAAGAGLAGVAAVALPVAAAFVVVEGAVQLTKVAFKAAGDAAHLAGQELSALARNDYLGAFQQGLSAATRAVSSVPLVGKALGAVGEAAEKTVGAFASVVQAFDQRASELAGLSPDIAMAQQRSEMRSLFDDLNEANTLGPDLAKMLDAESDLKHELRELLLPLKQVIIPALTDVLNVISSHVPEIGRALAALLRVAEFIVGVLDTLSAGLLHDQAKMLSAFLERMAQSLENIKRNTEKEKEVRNDPWFNDFINMDWRPIGADPWAGVGGDARPRIPIVEMFPGT